ncbi:hypothetical protein AMECASPLE_034462 [Ameca splendens]|uniref:Immunoglobulin subtype domain-containing protein n=1 Tax=Ameca splendens TaxID=208324 RepID=A0ABV0ZGZ3_9TELE
MSVAWLKVSTILCFFCTAEMKKEVFRESGQSVKIQCRIHTDQDFFILKLGLNEETDIAVIDKASRKTTFLQEMTGRIQTNGEFPSVDIVIKWLNLNDSGPYWCMYSKIDDSYKQLFTEGNGSIILVVSGSGLDTTTEAPKCDKPNLNVAVVYVHIAALALLGPMLGFIAMIMYKGWDSSSGSTPRQTENRL